VISESVLRRLDQLQLNMNSHARGGAGGLRRSRSLGSSVEFSDFREYVPGDDIRRVDWNAYARFDRLFLKLFMEEQETILTVILDASASMASEGKWDSACRVAEALAYLALRAGDRVMMICLQGDRAQESELFGGRAGYQKAGAFLAGIKPKGTTRLGASGARLKLRGTRGMAVVISDLFSEDEWQKCIAALLYRKRQTALVHVLSPTELAPDMNGAVRLIDSENGKLLDLLVNEQTMRAYRRTLEDFLAGAKSYCHKHAVGYAQISSGEDLISVLGGAMMRAGIVSA